MKLDSRSADAVKQVKPRLQQAWHFETGVASAAAQAPPRRRRCSSSVGRCRRASRRRLGARAADEPARPQPTTERASTGSVRAQPTAREFALPNQPDVSATGARDIDLLYRQLIGPPAASSPGSHSNTRLRAAPSDDAARSLSR
jgi:hypothetical protein